MEHLSTERLARLIDEAPDQYETQHLAECDVCPEELEALRQQTAALASLPEIRPPKGDWKVLEAQLRSEGLLRDPGLLQRLGMAQTPPWMKAAAAILLFLSGAGTGAVMTHSSTQSAESGLLGDRIVKVEDAASAVRSAEQNYVTAVARYRELLAEDGGDGAGSDPISRFAALEHLVRVSQAAVRQAPGDPFLNGFLASAMAERDAALRMVSANQDNWF
jgi:hypothetical protein